MTESPPLFTDVSFKRPPFRRERKRSGGISCLLIHCPIARRRATPAPLHIFKNVCCQPSSQRDDISITPDKAARPQSGAREASRTGPRHGRQARKSGAGDAAEKREETVTPKKKRKACLVAQKKEHQSMNFFSKSLILSYSSFVMISKSSFLFWYSISFNISSSLSFAIEAIHLQASDASSASFCIAALM